MSRNVIIIIIINNNNNDKATEAGSREFDPRPGHHSHVQRRGPVQLRVCPLQVSRDVPAIIIINNNNNDEAAEAGSRKFDPRPGHYSRMSF